MATLDDIENLLAEGLRLANQTSAARRLPAAASVPLLIEARDRLREHVKREPMAERAWRTLSRAEEALLAYSQAIAALERAVILSGTRDKRDRKRLAVLLTAATEWDALGLTPEELEELGAALADDSATGATDPLARTRAWLHAHRPTGDAQRILMALSAKGGVDDRSVLSRVVRGATL